MVAKKRKKFNLENIKKIFYFLVISFLMVVLIISCFNIFQKRIETERELENLNQEIDKLEKERDLLNLSLNEINSDEFLERMAREELRMQKPGEEVYIIKKDNSQKEEKIKEDVNFFEKIINWFKTLPE